MFIVAMTLAVIGAMGIYALNLTSMEVRTAGFVRQQVQTQYLSEYGALAAAQVVTGTGAQTYNTMMSPPATRDTGCVSLFGIPSTAKPEALACHRAGSAELAGQLGSPPFVTPWTSNATGVGRGSVGLPVQADFFVEVTDVNKSSRPAQGYGINSGGGGTCQCFFQFTVSSYGLTPTGVASAGTLAGYQSEAFEMSRARIISGPTGCGC